MRFLAGVFRVGLVGSVCVVVMVIGIGRFLPRVPAQLENVHRHARSPYFEITNYAVFHDQAQCRFLDPDTGKYVNLDLNGANTLLYGTSAPWQVDGEEMQVAGLWMGRGPDAVVQGFSDFGIIRCSFPSGRLIDQIPLDIFPIGNVCWFPDPPARLLFAGTNGKLYKGIFPGDANAVAVDSDENDGPTGGSHVYELQWACEPPGEGVLRMADPSWPLDPRMKNFVLVSLSYRVGSGRQAKYTDTRLWWLKLNREGTVIESAGPLFDGLRPGGVVAEERLPSVATTPDGGLALAYLGRDSRRYHWDLRLVPIVLDTATGQPSVRSSQCVRLAEDVAIVLPAFSTDGEWVYGIPLASTVSRTRAERFSVLKSLSAATGSRPDHPTGLSHAPVHAGRRAEPPIAHTGSHSRHS